MKRIVISGLLLSFCFGFNTQSAEREKTGNRIVIEEPITGSHFSTNQPREIGRWEGPFYKGRCAGEDTIVMPGSSEGDVAAYSLNAPKSLSLEDKLFSSAVNLKQAILSKENVNIHARPFNPIRLHSDYEYEKVVTPLMMHSFYDTKAVKLLIDAGAKVNERSNNGRTALVFAIYGRDPKKLESIKLLLEAKANPYIKDEKEHDAFWHAKRINAPDIEKLLHSYDKSAQPTFSEGSREASLENRPITAGSEISLKPRKLENEPSPMEID